MFKRRRNTNAAATIPSQLYGHPDAAEQQKSGAISSSNTEMLIGGLTFLSTVGPRRFRGHAQSALTIISVVSLALRALRRT